MATEFFDKWIAALESGEYEQTTGRLARDGEDGKRRFCCLGVACDLAVKDGIIQVREDAFGTIEYGDFSASEYNEDDDVNFSDAVLPVKVMKALGVESRDPVVMVKLGDYEASRTLAALNDDYAWDFRQIAEVARQELA